MSRMLRMCLNWKVLVGLALVAVGVWTYRPDLLGAALPILLLAACPLSMLWMMRGMRHGEHGGSNIHAPALPDDPAVLRARMTLAAEQERVSEQLARLTTPPSSSDDGPEIASTPPRPL